MIAGMPGEGQGRHGEGQGRLGEGGAQPVSGDWPDGSWITVTNHYKVAKVWR